MGKSLIVGSSKSHIPNIVDQVKLRVLSLGKLLTQKVQSVVARSIVYDKNLKFELPS